MATKDKQPKRKWVKVEKCLGIFKILIWDETKKDYIDLKSSDPHLRARKYKAIKNVKVLGKWKQKTKNFATLDEAKNWRRKDLKKSDITSSKTKSYTLKQLIADWRAWSKPPRLAPLTWQTYGKDISHFNVMLDIPVEEITASDIDQWLSYVIDPKYPKKKLRTSFYRELKVLTTIFNWYREYKNPTFQHSILKRHRRDCYFKEKAGKPDISLSVQDLEKFLAQLKQETNQMYYYLAWFQALTGARIGEACGLMWDCVNFQSQTVEIKRVCNWDLWTKQPKIRENTKTGVFRKIVMPEKLLQLLTEWKALNPEQHLVFHRKGELIKYNAIQRAYKGAFKKLGLPDRSTHVLRHSFASIYANQTRNIRGAQAALGHQDLRITQHYAKVTEQTQRDAIVDFEFGKIKKSNPSPDNGGADNVISLNSKRANSAG